MREKKYHIYLRDIENKYCHDRLGNETVKYIAVFIGYE